MAYSADLTLDYIIEYLPGGQSQIVQTIKYGQTQTQAGTDIAAAFAAGNVTKISVKRN